MSETIQTGEITLEDLQSAVELAFKAGYRGGKTTLSEHEAWEFFLKQVPEIRRKA
jgi:hypothetical protein